MSAPPDRGVTGPFDTEEQARLLPAVQAVYAAFRRDPGAGKMTAHNRRMLLDALAAAGVYLGAYDHRIADWLAGWEPQTVAVIAGWVQRASQAREGPPGREGEGGPRDLPAEDRPLCAEYPPPPPQQPQGSVTQSVSRGGVSGGQAAP